MDLRDVPGPGAPNVRDEAKGETVTDYKALFDACWDHQYAKQRERSPSYQLSDYAVTGKAGAAYGGKRGVEWWGDNGPEMVARWDTWKRENQWTLWETPTGLPGIELEFLVTLPGDIVVKMFLDRVFVLPSGQLCVVDIKTGSRMPTYPEQLGLYACGLELTFGPEARPDWGYYWDANKGTHTQPLALGQFTVDVMGKLYQQAIDGHNAGVFLPNPQNNCGNWCGVADYCYAVGGSKAAGIDPLARV